MSTTPARRTGATGAVIAALTLFALLLTGLPSPSASAATAAGTTRRTPVADTYANASAPTTAHGTRTSAYASTSTNRALLTFDTKAAVPAGSRLTAATLRLYVLHRASTAAGLEVHPAPTTWTEATLTARNRPVHDSRALSGRAPVTAAGTWVSVPLKDLSTIALDGLSSFELLHAVSGAQFQFATRESANPPVLELAHEPVPATAPAPAPRTGPLPFDSAALERNSRNRLAFAHYFTPYPVSIDNAAPSSDYYARHYLNPDGENGKHAAYGGLLRDRSLPREPLSGDWEGKDFEREVRQAIDAGLDGFTVDLLSLTSHHWTRTKALLDAAQRVDPGFKIMLMPDMTTLGGQESATLAAKVAELGRHPSAHKLPDGRLVVSPYRAEVKSASWWSTWLGTMSSAHGTRVAFVPTFLDWRNNMDSFAPISHGFSAWGERSTKGVAGVEAAATKAHQLGKIWMAPVAVQDVRPNQGTYWEAGNTETLRASWASAIAGNAEWVQIPTWNDYSENTSVAPSVNHGWTFLDVSAYSMVQWKNGTAPAVVRDGLYLTSRTQPVAARQSYPQTKLMTLRSGSTPARDTVEALTFLTAPATVTVTVGAATHSWQAPAGVSAKTLPLATGRISGTVVRSGTTTTAVTAPFTVTSTPRVQDLSYHGVSSLR